MERLLKYPAGVQEMTIRFDIVVLSDHTAYLAVLLIMQESGP
jgi:hypothetical protein